MPVLHAIAHTKKPSDIVATYQNYQQQRSGTDGTARFAAYLQSRSNGPDALFQYFKVLGQVKYRDVVFEQLFGLSFATFEADFERVRRDFGVATQYFAQESQRPLKWAATSFWAP